MIKKLLLAFSILMATYGSFAQNDILLVTDNNFDVADNTQFYNSILTTSYTSVVLHNANTDGLPTLSTFNDYDLVIWFAGDDGFELNFWNNSTVGYADLNSYLDNGGKLWLIGSDIIYEMYGSAPETFTPGEFMYDYAWLESYDMQTFADDGGLGVPQIDRTSQVSTDYPSPLTWIFATLYYIDGVTPRTGSIPVYQFGPSSYPFVGETTMAFYENDTFSVMSTFFNPTSIDITSTGGFAPNNDLEYFIQATLDQIFASSLSVNTESFNTITFNTYPNPSQDYFNIIFNNDTLLNADFKIYSLLGKTVLTGKLTNYTTEVSTKNLSKGTYFLKVGSITKKIIKQ